LDVPRYHRLGFAPESLGYFIGLSAAGFWDYTNLFVTPFFRNGLSRLHAWITTGQLRNVDQITTVPAWSGNFLVILGCLWAYARLNEKSLTDLGHTHRLRSHHRLFRSRYRALPTALLAALPWHSAPASSLVIPT
jgi:hypothetical protein